MKVVNAAHVRQQLLNRSEDSEDEGMSERDEDTWVFPLIQMKPLGIQVDEQVTQVRLDESFTPAKTNLLMNNPAEVDL